MSIKRFLAACALWFFAPLAGFSAGVTLITHGLNGDTDGWVTGMATNIPSHYRFVGTNYSCYKMYFYSSGGSYYLTASRVAGTQPFAPESGEIVVKLDWGPLADGNSYNTYQIASAVVPALLNTNFIPELGGHALAEFPVHLIGHSRGGSLVCEISRLLGTNGVWVDHLTTLDPHPLNNDGFFDFPYSAVDAPARTYMNVLFHDNYFQTLNFFVYGKDVPGAYVRQLTYLDGGYGGLTASHSDVHLWYHGTIDFRNPASDTAAILASAERQTWWISYEDQGVFAGFDYSLIAGGDRLSGDRPVGNGFPAIRDGYNQWWDVGAGMSPNRTALTSNSGSWPSLIRFNRTQTNRVVQGQSSFVKYFYQWAQPTNSAATVSFYLDDDYNPLNSNEQLLKQVSVPGTTASSVAFQTISLPFDSTNASPGLHSLFAKITAAGKSRFLYAPELVEVIPIRQPPTLDIAKVSSTQFRIGVNGLPGQRVIVENSTNLQTWFPVATNTLSTNRWLFTNTPPTATQRFYRGFIP